MMRSRGLRIVVRWRAARSRLARFVGGSLAAHGVVLAVLVIVPSFHRAAPPIDDAMVVALAGPLPGPPAAARASAAPPSPAPQPATPPPAPKDAHAVREVPKPNPKPAKPAPKPKEETKPAPPQAEPPPDNTKPSEGTGTAGGGGAAEGAPTGVTGVLGGGDSSLGFYQAAVQAALESAWQKPVLEDQGDTYSVTVSFTIARDGSTRDVRVSQSSGVPSLDRSAIRAVMGASPLPPVPAAWSGDEVPATIRFDLNPESL